MQRGFQQQLAHTIPLHYLMVMMFTTSVLLNHHGLHTLLGFVNFKLHESINLKYPPIVDPRLKALADQPSGTNDEESEHSHEPDALMNPVVNVTFVRWSNERPLENKELNAIISAWFTLSRE
nr:pescadillo homolog [Tanacetum cinerariifolium]